MVSSEALGRRDCAARAAEALGEIAFHFERIVGRQVELQMRHD
jgi:hypothetical protein